MSTTKQLHSVAILEENLGPKRGISGHYENMGHQLEDQFNTSCDNLKQVKGPDYFVGFCSEKARAEYQTSLLTLLEMAENYSALLEQKESDLEACIKCREAQEVFLKNLFLKLD